MKSGASGRIRNHHYSCASTRPAWQAVARQETPATPGTDIPFSLNEIFPHKPQSFQSLISACHF
jgi:hypothetical protein